MVVAAAAVPTKRLAQEINLQLRRAVIPRCRSAPPMPFSLESLAALATIAGLAVSLLALVHSRAWLVLASLAFVAAAVTAGVYARRERLALKSASTALEGYSIDSLNMANLRRRVNRTFVIQEADHTVRIEGEDMTIEWKYAGFCKTGRESAMEFSLDSEATVNFDDMDCVAFDLGHDPGMAHPIRPLLIGSDGISKKISVPFLEPVTANQPFGMLLKCTLPRCVTVGSGYYTSTLSFAQDRVRRCTVRLIFVGAAPAFMRVYEGTPGRPIALVKNLAPSRREPGLCEYVDVAADREGQSARVYLFWREHA